jgi:hypothetical protein
LIDGLVGAVVGGFELAVWAMFCIGLVVVLAAVRMRGFPADDDRTRAQIRDRPHGRETVVHHCGGRAVTMGLVAFGQGGRPNPSLRLVFRR